MSAQVNLPSWVGALEPLVNIALGISPTIPFTSTEAICNPGSCMQMVTEEQWEHDVIEPLLRSHYGNGSKFSDAFLKQFTQYDVDEAARVECYETGLSVARAHQAIWSSQLKDRFRDVESLCWERSDKLRRFFVTKALAGVVTMTQCVPLRLDCPDLTVSLLCENNGRLLSDIIRTIIESASRYPKGDNYISIVSEPWDEYYEIDRKNKTIGSEVSFTKLHHQTLAEHRRNYAIALFVGCLCHNSLYEDALVEPTQLLNKPRLPSSKSGWYRSNSFADSNRPLWPYSIDLQHSSSPGEVAFVLMNTSKREIACRSCARFAIEVKELVEEGKDSLSCCARCLRMGRQVAYCGKDCQEKDWKSAHRRVCGKKVSDVDLPKPQPLSPSERPISLPLRLQLQPHLDSSEDFYTLKIEVGRTTTRGLSAPDSQLTDLIDLKMDSEGRELLDQAVVSRESEDVRLFIDYVFKNNSLGSSFSFSRETRESIASQIAYEWDIDVESVSKWIVLALKERAEAKGYVYVEISAEEEEEERAARCTLLG